MSTHLSKSRTQLSVFGCGVLGSAIVDGLTSGPELAKSYKICLTGRRSEHIDELRKKYRDAYVSSNNGDPNIWASSPGAEMHIAIVGTHPGDTQQICTDITEAFTRNYTPTRLVVLTMCPGITIRQLQEWLPAETPIVRSMPNTPVAVGQGSVALFPNSFVQPQFMEEVKRLLSLTSPCIEILEHEGLLDVAASVSGSAPAYLFYLMRAMVDAAVQKGMPENQAKSLIIQSMIGGGFLSQCSHATMTELLGDVCVPGGSTEKAMATLGEYGVHDGIIRAVDASWQANVKMGAKTSD